MEERRARRFKLLGIPFQLLFVACYLATDFVRPPTVHYPPFKILSIVGWLIFLYYFIKLYWRSNDKIPLITTGMFKYTRHPMYTGVVILDLIHWNPFVTPTPGFLAVQALFFASVIIAGYLQEQETLARFGKEAEEYYAITPRLIISYPLRYLFSK